MTENDAKFRLPLSFLGFRPVLLPTVRTPLSNHETMGISKRVAVIWEPQRKRYGCSSSSSRQTHRQTHTGYPCKRTKAVHSGMGAEEDGHNILDKQTYQSSSIFCDVLFFFYLISYLIFSHFFIFIFLLFHLLHILKFYRLLFFYHLLLIIGFDWMIVGISGKFRLLSIE